MSITDSDEAYRRLRLASLVLVALFVVYLGLFAWSNPPEDADVTFETYPAAATGAGLYVAGYFGAVVVSSYYVPKDSGRLADVLADVDPKSWKRVALYTFVSLGFYLPYYTYRSRKRRNQLRDQEEPLRAAREAAESALEDARNAAERGEHERAVERTREAQQQASNAVERAEEVGRAAADLEELRDRALVERARFQLERADRLADDGRYEDAAELAAESHEAVRDLRDPSGEGDVAATARELDERIRQRRLDWARERGASELAAAEREAEDDGYEAAAARARQAAALVTEALAEVETTGVDAGDVEQFRERARGKQGEWELAALRETVAAAREAAAGDDYDRAVDLADEAEAAAESLRDDESSAADATDVEAVAAEAADLRDDCERELLVARINDASDGDVDDPERAREDLESVLSAIAETDALSDRERALLREEARTATLQVLASAADAKLREGTELAERDEHERAREAFEEAVETVAEARATADDWAVDEPPELDRVRSAAEERFVETLVAAVETAIERGIDAFEDGEYERARDTFTDAAEEAGRAADRVEDEDAGDRLRELRSVAEDNSDAASRAVLGIGSGGATLRDPRGSDSSVRAATGGDATDGSGADGADRADTRAVEAAEPEDEGAGTDGVAGGPPSTIPSMPDLDVEYGDISKGERIGEGGSADIFEATVETPDGTYTGALKEPRMSGTLHGDVMDRFVTEAETWAELDDHDFVVDVMARGSTPLPWLLMEYMDGGNLSEYTGALSFDQAVWTARCVTEGVYHAHSHGVAHLDLKPENVLFRTTGAETWPVPKVGDWGLVRALLGDDGGVDGLTPQYAAPEQVDPDRFGDPDQATDVYQLGAVFYALFVGRPPVEGEGGTALERVLDGDVVAPSEADPSLPAALDDVLLTALAREKADRYESVLYLRDALEAIGE